MAASRRTAQAESAPQHHPVVASTADVARMRARQTFAAMPIEQRLADVCPGCGQHVLMDEDARVAFIKNGGTITCQNCQIEKTRTQ